MKHVIIAAFAVLLLGSTTSCVHYHKVMQRPGIQDGKRFGRVELPTSESAPYIFASGVQMVSLPSLETWGCDKAIAKYDVPEVFLEESHTAALLVIRNDTILYERYFNGHGADSITQVFSITKPLTASLLAQALTEGRIQSLDEPVSNYLPVRQRGKKSTEVSLRHLGNMQSGFNHNDYLHLAKIIRFYHAVDADRYLKNVKVVREPGTRFTYKSIDTQVLGTCLEKIFDEENLLDRFVQTYWNVIGPENTGYFSIDHPSSGNLKYYGGLNISARDLAKVGRIFLQDGAFGERQVLPPSWMEMVHDPANQVGEWRYAMGWYFDEQAEGRDIFYGSGFNGQILLLNRTNNTIVIRLGEAKAGHDWFHLMSELSMQF